MIDATLRPGYIQIEAASLLPPDSGAWAPFMRDVLGLPMEMLPAVQWAVKANMWRSAGDPVASVRANAGRRAAREWHAAPNGDAAHTIHKPQTEREFIERRLRGRVFPAYLTASEIATAWGVSSELVRRAFSDRAARGEAVKYFRGSHPYYFRIPVTTFLSVRDELNAGLAERDRYPDIDPVTLTAI